VLVVVAEGLGLVHACSVGGAEAGDCRRAAAACPGLRARACLNGNGAEAYGFVLER